MLVELQIDVEAFKKAFREQMRKALACQLTEDFWDTVPYVITGYTLTDTKIRRSQLASPVCIHTGGVTAPTTSQVKKPQLVQTVIAHLSWRSDLVTANAAKAASIPLTLPVVFDMAMDTCGNMSLLCLTYVGLDGIDDALAKKLGQTIHTKCISLPIDSVIGGYMPPKVGLVNSHLTLVQGDKSLAVRMEFWETGWGSDTGDPVHTVAEWENFYTGSISDHLTPAPGENKRDGWSIFIDHLALTQFVHQTISDSVSGKSDLIVTRQPVATWYDNYQLTNIPANRVHANMQIKKVDACWCFTENISVTADVNADVLISVPSDNTIRIDVYVDVSPDFWDAACCVLTAAVFWPILGLGQTIKGKIKDWQYWLGFLPFVALVGAILGINDAGSDFPPPNDFKKDPDNDNHVFKLQVLNLPNDPNLGKLTLRGAHPMTDTTSLNASGLYLFGDLETFVLPQPELQDPVLEPFAWGSGGHCSRRVAANSSFRLYPVDPHDWALLQSCDIHKLDDPLGVFDLRVERGEFTDVFLQADYYAMSKHYWEPQNRYPCRLMIKTTGGVRILTMPPMPEMTQEQFEALYQKIQLEFVNYCYYPRHRLFEELDWPIEVLIEQPGLQNWTVRASGVDPGETFQLVDERGNTGAKFTANRNGTLLVNALGRLQGAQPVLSLRRGMSGRTALLAAPQTAVQHQLAAPEAQPISPTAAIPPNFAEDPNRGVTLRQTQFAERRQIRLSGECLAMTAADANGGPRLIVVTEGQVQSFDVTDASAPSLSGTWRAEGVRGALTFGGELILWGTPGIWAANDGPPARAKVPFGVCYASPEVRGAEAVRDRLFVLQDDEIHAFGPDLCELCRHDACGAEQIAASGDFIVLRDPDGLRVFNGVIGSPEDPIFTALRGASHLETPSVELGCDTIYARGRVGTVLLQIMPSGELDRIAEYETGAWFEGVVRAGKTLAFPTTDRRSVTLVEVIRTAKSE